MRVAISGASSFTGTWIACEFAQAGFETYALTAEDSLGDSGSLRQKRFEKMRLAGVRCHAGILAESGAMRDWIAENCPQLWIHHHHWMEGYRSENYDLERARSVGIAPLPGILDALARAQAAAIFSGSFFEPGEGGNPIDAQATSYAKNKKETWLEFEKLALERSLRLGKVVIPNPIGPLENEDRLIPQMIRAAREGKEFPIRAPRSVSDYLPAQELALAYLELAEFLSKGASQQRAPMVVRPSGKTVQTLEFAREISDELIEKRLGLRCLLQAAPQSSDGGARIAYRNPVAEKRSVDWDAFWDLYAGV